MAGEMLLPKLERMDLATFHAFRNGRPDARNGSWSMVIRYDAAVGARASANFWRS